MKKTLLTLAAVAALALPASALAHDGHHSHHVFPMLTGTGTSFGSTSATASGTNWSATLATTWSSAQTKTFSDGDTLSCAPATASITVNGTATSLDGRTCTFTKNGQTFGSFLGRNTSLDKKGVLFEKPDGTVKAGVLTGFHLGEFAFFGGRDHHGDCHH